MSKAHISLFQITSQFNNLECVAHISHSKLDIVRYFFFGLEVGGSQKDTFSKHIYIVTNYIHVRSGNAVYGKTFYTTIFVSNFLFLYFFLLENVEREQRMICSAFKKICAYTYRAFINKRIWVYSQ